MFHGDRDAHFDTGTDDLQVGGLARADAQRPGADTRLPRTVVPWSLDSRAARRGRRDATPFEWTGDQHHRARHARRAQQHHQHGRRFRVRDPLRTTLAHRALRDRDLADGIVRAVTEGVDAQLQVRDLGPDLWIWRVLHPGWTEDADWQPMVTCTVVDLGQERLVVAPLGPPLAP